MSILKNKALLGKALKRHIRNPKKCLLAQICWPEQPTSQAEYIEEQFGIPPKLLHLIEGLYLNLPAQEQPVWVARLIEQVEDGADLSLIVNKFLVWLLVDPQKGVIAYAATPNIKIAIKNVASLHLRVVSGEEVAAPEWVAARETARGAAGEAARAAREAARAARAAAEEAVEWAAWAAWAAKEAAREVAWAATREAAWVAAEGAAWAAREAAEGAAWAAREAARAGQREKLESLLQSL